MEKDAVGETGLAATLEHATPASEGLARGTSVGRYLILGELGGGGMGVVYAAYDPQLDRKVAVKLLRDTADTTEDGRTRLLREAHALARLSHPNVVAVYDVGTYAGYVFVATELVDGVTLGAWMRERRAPVDEVLAMFVQAGRGLAAAHAAGLVHRDFKPDNVLVGRDGRARVLDFGLARAVATPESPAPAPAPKLDATTAVSTSSAPLATPLTRAGAIMGTPLYMAPEQFRGAATDARTDQFSFCVALYEALYRARPFAGDTLAALGEEVLAGRIKPPPKGRAPSWVRPIVLRGLSVDAAGRFPSMDALLDELARDPRPRRRRALAAGLVAGAVLALGIPAYYRVAERRLCRGAEARLAGVWDEARRNAARAAFTATGRPYAEASFAGAARALDDYARGWIAQRTEACEATRVRGEQSAELLDQRMVCLDERREELKGLVDLMTRADGELVERAVRAAQSLSVVDGCAAASAWRAPRRPSDPVMRGRVDELARRIAAVRALDDAGHFAEGSTAAASVVEVARALGHRPTIAEATELLGVVQSHAGDSRAAAATIEQAIFAGEASGHEELLARAWTNLASARTRLARYDAAEEAVAHATATLEHRGGDPLGEARLDRVLGALRDEQGRYAEASTAGRRALTLLDGRVANDSFEVAATLSNLADSLLLQGQYDEARADFERALAIWERAVGRDHPYYALALGNLGALEHTVERYEIARGYFQRELAILERTLGPEHPDLAEAVGNLGNSSFRLHRFADARALAERALKLREHALGPDHPAVAQSLVARANALAGLHRDDEALADYERAIRIVEKANGPRHPTVASYLADEARLFVAAKSWDRALAAHTRALAIWEAADPRSEDTAIGLVLVAEDQLMLGAAKQSLALGERALAFREKAPGRPTDLADAQFVVARALHAASRECARASRLAAQARDGYAAAGAAGAPRRDEVVGWLEKNGACR